MTLRLESSRAKSKNQSTLSSPFLFPEEGREEGGRAPARHMASRIRVPELAYELKPGEDILKEGPLQQLLAGSDPPWQPRKAVLTKHALGFQVTPHQCASFCPTRCPRRDAALDGNAPPTLRARLSLPPVRALNSRFFLGLPCAVCLTEPGGERHPRPRAPVRGGVGGSPPWQFRG